MADQAPLQSDDLASRARAMRSRLRAARIWSRLSIFWESAAPAILPLGIVIALYLICSWLGLFRIVPDFWRIGLGSLFVFCAVCSLYFLRLMRWPSAHEVDARIEHDNHLMHQPITAQNDHLAIGDDAFARTLWRLHQRKLAERVDGVRGANARTNIPQIDPYALRTLLPLALVSAFAFSLGTSGGSVFDVLRSHGNKSVLAARIDAWITPPHYTGVAPIFLTSQINAARTEYAIPEGSKIVVRISGGSGSETVFYPDGQSAVPLNDDDLSKNEARQFEIAAREDGELQISTQGNAYQWHISLIEDQAPEIAFDGKLSRAANGTMTIAYIAADDFGLARANAYVELADDKNKTARPLYKAPEIKLVLPRRNSDGKAKTAIDLTEHPWAGARVKMVLEAEDDLEQMGRSQEIQVELPGRPFSKPLARALIEQRRNLALDANRARAVYDMLDLFLLYPEETINNTAHFLGITTALSKLRYARSDDDLRDVVDYLWEVARNIEDGGLSEAERRLKDAQQALSEALENGASDEEVEQLMSELRDAMKEFLSEFARQNQNSPNFENPQNQQNTQQLDQQSLDELLNRLEELAKSGARDQAQEMLSQLQNMMNNLQMGQHQRQQGDGQNQAQQQMNELGNILREQQELMNDTFKRSQRGDQGDEGQDPSQGQNQNDGQSNNGQGQQGQRSGEFGQNGNEGGQQQGQQGQQGFPEDENQGQGMDGQGKGGTGESGIEGLAEGQQALQDRLDQLKEGLRGMGINPDDAFDDAGRAMGDAGEALGKGLGDRALNKQSSAMEALRRGAQKMMEQMQQANQGQTGASEPGGTQNAEGRDPLGRPQGSSGPDFGDSVKIPDEIDVRRAREILEAIRKRLGVGALEQFEKDYLERLLDLD